MALVIEDGTNVADANSYATRAEFIAFAGARGVTVPDTDATDVHLVKAMDYLEMLTARYVGTRTYETQVLSWPRTDVVLYDLDFPEDEIPALLKKAQMQLALHSFQGIDLAPAVHEKFVISETVGPISTTYSQAVNTNSQPYFPLVDAWLSALLTSAGKMALRLVRV